MTEIESRIEPELEARPKTESEAFIAAHVTPRLAPGEVILHTGYLMGELHGRGIGLIVGAISLRACFIAVSQTRVFFLWNVPGRIGAFRPLLECGHVQIADRRHVSGN